MKTAAKLHYEPKEAKSPGNAGIQKPLLFTCMISCYAFKIDGKFISITLNGG